MKNVRVRWTLVLAAVAALAACSDGPDGGLPTNPRSGPRANATITLGQCTTLSALQGLAGNVFGIGSPNVNSVLGKLANMQKKITDGDVVGAQEQATNIVRFVRDKAAQGSLVGTQAQIDTFISGVLCYAGLSPDTFLIMPSDEPQVRTSEDGQSGVSLDGNTVTEPTLITINTLDPDTSVLDTKLDKYPTYIAITTTSALTKPAVVAVCPSVAVPAEVRERLRLGHQTGTGFEITPPADASFLQCDTPTTTASRSRVSRWMQGLASLVGVKPLYAAAAMVGGGVGGSVTEFSPFGTVDPDVSFKGGGVGGSVTEFKRAFGPRGQSLTGEPKSRVMTSAASESGCTDATAVVGTELAVECRPYITVTTHNGVILSNVPVTWTVTVGGGTIAPAGASCGTFAGTFETTSDAAGFSSACWVVGDLPGPNTVTAQPHAGGDAPSGVTFTPHGVAFTAIGVRITPIATATGGTFEYDGAAHAGSGTCSHDLTPVYTYSGGSAPVHAGTTTLTVTCGEGNPRFNVVSATATITITKKAATATAGSAVMNFGTAVPPISCAVTGLIPADVGSVTCTASIPAITVAGSYATVPVVSPTNPANYQVTPVNGTLTVMPYVQVGCFSSPIYSAMPTTKSAQKKGSNLPVKCTLTNQQGVAVTNATGGITVVDRGTTGTAAPITVLSQGNVFRTSGGGSYAYGLDTSPAGFIVGHYYFVTATWNDGTTTSGWFLLK